jgi:hypothetical protein
MKPGRISYDGALLCTLCAMAAVLALGCASTPPPPPDARSELVAAGFKVVTATTREQQEHLQTLSAGQVTAWQRTGRIFYVYPDVARNQLYVGTQKEYEAFRRLVPSSGPTLAGQAAADMASYDRQDQALRRGLNREAADPYSFWESFDTLGW